MSSTVSSQKRPRGRPRDLGKAEAVLDAAWALFLERGVAAVPIEAIAAAAHVSKGTLYACYPDKTALFEAAVRREMERIEAAQGVTRGAPADTPLRETLQAFGMGIMSFLASEPAVGFYNALSAELRLHPNLAKAFWDLGPGQTRANLAAILGAAAERGEITIDDPFESAEGLFGMWQGFSNLQLALALLPSDRDAWISGRVARGIDLFMRAHARAARETE
jgi:TetR/AcrR family transcriptional repressor of mexJK operon